MFLLRNHSLNVFPLTKNIARITAHSHLLSMTLLLKLPNQLCTELSCPVLHQPHLQWHCQVIITIAGTQESADYVYAWTTGGFIKSNQAHWSSNGKPVAEFNGTPYYRAHSSMLGNESFEELSKTNMQKPIYDTSQASDFPIVIDGIKDAPSYLGYRLMNGFPIFRYSLGKHTITELIQMNTEKNGIQRTFTLSPPVKLTFKLTPSKSSSIASDCGKITTNGTLSLSKSESSEFSIFISPKE